MLKRERKFGRSLACLAILFHRHWWWETRFFWVPENPNSVLSPRPRRVICASSFKTVKTSPKLFGGASVASLITAARLSAETFCF